MAMLSLTGTAPVRITSEQAQPLDQALDISGYSAIDAIASLIGLVGSTSGVTIVIQTSMQRDSEDGWVTLLTFPAAVLTGPNTHDPGSVTIGLLRYIRWKATDLGGATSITFSISGMLRPER